MKFQRVDTQKQTKNMTGQLGCGLWGGAQGMLFTANTWKQHQKTNVGIQYVKMIKMENDIKCMKMFENRLTQYVQIKRKFDIQYVKITKQEQSISKHVQQCSNYFTNSFKTSLRLYRLP